MESGLTSPAGKTYRRLLQASWRKMMRTGAEVLVGLKKRADFKGPKLEDMVDLSRRRAEKNGG